MTQAASEDCSLFRKEGVDMANHDHEVPLYHPVASIEPLFTNDMDGIDADRRESVAYERYVHAYAAYRRRMVQLGSTQLVAIGPEEGIDFEVFGQAWAMMDLEEGVTRQPTPRECCGGYKKDDLYVADERDQVTLKDLFDPHLRAAWTTFLRGYHMYFKRNAPMTQRPPFRLYLPKKSLQVAETAAA